MEKRARTLSQSYLPNADADSETGNTMDDGVSDLAGESLAGLQLREPDIGPVLRWRLQQTEAPSIDELRPESAAVKELWSQWHSLVVREDVLYRQWTGKDSRPGVMQLLVPAILRTDFIRRAHEGMCGGHLSVKRTLDQIQRRGYWRQWRRDVERLLPGVSLLGPEARKII